MTITPNPRVDPEDASRAVRAERMHIVVTGHVDHGKSTVIGRLLADTGSLPQGKLEAVRTTCERNAKPFEYAFLLDALKDEQVQGITIDSARVFFKTARRNYIILDAPGHIEFLKNMITGASRAEAALLVIDAHEGIQENSRRHGYHAGDDRHPPDRCAREQDGFGRVPPRRLRRRSRRMRGIPRSYRDHADLVHSGQRLSRRKPGRTRAESFVVPGTNRPRRARRVPRTGPR